MSDIKYVLINQSDLNLCFNASRKLIKLCFHDHSNILMSVLTFDKITSVIGSIHRRRILTVYLFSFKAIKPFNHYYFHDDYFPVIDIYSPDEVQKLYETYSILV